MYKVLEICTALAALALASGAHAAGFPARDRPITIVVPFAAGAPTDRLARELAEAMRKSLGGAAIVVDNAAGAGGTIGANKVAKAPADGYTILLHDIGMATSPSLYRHLPYRTLDDFEYIGLVDEVPMTLIGRPSLPANTFSELRAWLRSNRKQANLANAGVGAASHLCGLLFMKALKLDITTVSYKGTGPAMTDLIGGQIDLMCDQATDTTEQIEAHKVKAYAVTAPRRLATPALRDLPTLQESGLKDFDLTIWHGLYAPKGTPPEALDKLNHAMRAALGDPDFVHKREGLGALAVSDKRAEPAEHRNFVAGEIARWAPVIKAAGGYAD